LIIAFAVWRGWELIGVVILVGRCVG